jgi:Uma2 family endonuclease
MITSINQLDLNKRYTYSDYIVWKFQERVELIKGRLFKMVAPNLVHQKISSNLHGFLWSHIKGSDCDVFTAPFDVRLPLPKHKIKGNKINTVVQPDLCVICDADKLDKQGCVGAPDLVIEILSPGNSKKEMKDKYNLYEEAGVLEYWVVDPERRNILVFLLDSKKQRFSVVAPILTDEDILKSKAIEGFEVPLAEVFPKEEK